ncbi:hypothetical protein JAO29_22030 [Edaphobacter sp. HDX4]|uniref:hypothetical protein n=1 Tax=Edaphobacter sp. HDX4 TaxID=2794064 RepID=UPI002FE6241E
MLTLFPGRECSISFRPSVAEGDAILTDQNTINAETGSKIFVQVGSKTYYVAVTATTKINNLINRDNVILHGSMVSAAPGRFRRVSETRYRLFKAMGTRKAKISLVAILLSIGLGTATSINASQHGASSAKPCTGFSCVTTPTWILMGFSAAAALFGWTKDNVL